MHILHVITLVLLLALVGAEFAISAFVNPCAAHLERAAQASLLGRLAVLLGKVMPPWYAADLILLGTVTWCHKHDASFSILLAATVIWLLATVGSILFLVPLNNRVIAGSTDWQEAHRSWDRRHRLRVAALTLSSFLFAYAIVP